LTQAVEETFKQRNTKLSNRFAIYQDEFKYNENKQIQWKAFLRRQISNIDLTFPVCIDKINEFIEPLFLSSNKRSWDPEIRKWM